MLFRSAHKIFSPTIISCIIALLLLPSVIYAFGTENSDEGVLLVREPAGTSSAQSNIEEPGRNPFSWSSEIRASFQKSEEEEIESIFELLHLSGIMWDETLPIAIINDIVLKEGEEINGIVVRGIFRNEVLLEHGDQHHFLKFKELFDLDNRGMLSEKTAGGLNE